MGALLEAFGTAFAGAGWLAASAALAWGALSVLLSPCHLSSVPLVVAYMSGGGALPAPRRVALVSGAFALGNLVSIAAVGLVTVSLGRMAGDVGRAGTYGLAAVFLVFGLDLVGVLPLPSWSMPAGSRLRGAAGALVLGAVSGAALGPCTFAFMAPLLALAFRAGAGASGQGAALVMLYALGHAAAIVLAGVSIQGLQGWLASRRGARAAATARVAAGGAVLAGGVYILLTAAP